MTLPFKKKRKKICFWSRCLLHVSYRSLQTIRMLLSGDTAMPVMLVPSESLQIQVLASKLEIASHCDVLFPIPLKQMGYWFTADSFSKCGLWQWSWKQVCEASSPIPALKCSSRLKTVGWRQRGCWAVNGIRMEKLHVVMNIAKVCDLAYCMWCWLYQSLKQMWGKIELHFLPATPGPLWLSGGLWCFRKIPYIPVWL